MLVRAGGRIHALANTCSHLGGPLCEGTLHEGGVVCPWHGSRFDLETGEVLDGPAVFPAPRFETRVRDGRIELRAER
jgi:nitrite reductase/ring-hydroxylating ferredoxin subunit